jgi:hypothetical protein
MKKAVFLFLLLQLATGLSVLFAQATNFEGYEIPEQKEIINDTALFNRLNSLENDFTKFKMIDELLEKAYYSKKLLNYVYLQLDFAKKKNPENSWLIRIIIWHECITTLKSTIPVLPITKRLNLSTNRLITIPFCRIFIMNYQKPIFL